MILKIMNLLLFKNKIVIGDFKDKVDIMNLEFY